MLILYECWYLLIFDLFSLGGGRRRQIWEGLISKTTLKIYSGNVICFLSQDPFYFKSPLCTMLVPLDWFCCPLEGSPRQHPKNNTSKCQITLINIHLEHYSLTKPQQRTLAPNITSPEALYLWFYSESSTDKSLKTRHGPLSTQTALLLFALSMIQSVSVQTVLHLKIKVKPFF